MPFPEPIAFGERIKRIPYHFDQPDLLAEHLQGVTILYNTYWVRFNHRLFKHADAVRNTLTLFEAAKKAGVQRIVHVSITNPSEDSPLEYFRGKAILEKALVESGDLLCHPSAGGPFREGGHPHQQHRLGLAAAAGVRRVWRRALPFAADLRRRSGGTGGRAGQKRENVVINAIGPETFTYRELVTKIGQWIGKTRPIISVPPWFGYAVGRLLGVARWRRDHHAGRDRGPHGRSVVRRCTAHGKNGFDRVDQLARRHPGAQLHQRIGTPERPEVGIPVELKRSYTLRKGHGSNTD